MSLRIGTIFSKLREQIADFLYPQPKVGIAVIVAHDGLVLFGQRAKRIGDGTWQVSGGHLEFMEDVEACALRELFEETNLRGVNPRIVTVTDNPYTEERKHYITIWVIVEVVNPLALLNREPTKCHGWKWFSIDNLPSPMFEASNVLTPDGLRKAMSQSVALVL